MGADAGNFGNDSTAAVANFDDSPVMLTNRTDDETFTLNSTEPPLPQPLLPETTAYWSREPYAWSTSIQDYTPPLLTSSKCSKAFYDVFRNTYYTSIGTIDPLQPNFLLSVIVESSSHPSGLNALFAQPYMYAGPGLGNMDLCPLQTCISGGRSSDSITFASVCIVPECSAYDLASEDFVSTMARQYDFAMDGATPQETIDLGREYVLLLRRIAEINKFLKTGWTCGTFVVPFEWFPFGGPYLLISILFVVASLRGTAALRRRPNDDSSTTTTKGTKAMLRKDFHIMASSKSVNNDAKTLETAIMSSSFSDEETSSLLQEKPDSSRTPPLSPPSKERAIYDEIACTAFPLPTVHSKVLSQEKCSTNYSVNTKKGDSSFWSAFDAARHLQRLLTPDHAETACLDGLRVGSIVWIMLGHVMAIQSSSGAGYSNPSNFLPPAGLTTTLLGQLLFSSRLAVDTFLVISGYLVVHVLLKKAPLPRSPCALSFWKDVILRYVTALPVLLLTRMGRILPLYAMCLGFYTQIAPQLGGGPFWHQWIHLLQPCHDAVWTNFFFVNNFIPLDTPTTSTCFYHSWYLAVDMQLFVVAPLLVFWYQYNRWHGQFVSILLFLASVVLTAYWSYTRNWSVNTFDGNLVMRYDMEAYANPLIRAQSYLAGMYVAMLLHIQKQEPCIVESRWRSRYTWSHRAVMALTLVTLLGVTFISVTGAYARRPCTYEEDPFSDSCGSRWSPSITFLYTSFGRTIWVIGICIVIHLCIDRGRLVTGDGNLAAAILSWTCWTPLSQLSFGAYLIHPIVIFVWQLGDREKRVFRLITFAMDYLSVCVVSFATALVAAILVEFPLAVLWKNFLLRFSIGRLTSLAQNSVLEPNACNSPTLISPLNPPYEDYGSLKPCNGNEVGHERHV
jgi:peptidoglycan/LPS O-acetylase OafA/YrhL